MALSRFDTLDFIGGPKDLGWVQNRQLRGDRLISTFESGAVVSHLGAWPPRHQVLRCDLVQAALPHPKGGWALISRQQREPPPWMFGLWRHPSETLGESPEPAHQLLRGASLHALYEIGGQLYTHAGSSMPSKGEPVPALHRIDGDAALVPVPGLPRGRLHQSPLHARRHLGCARLADGRAVLIWDSDGWELDAHGAFQRTFPLGLTGYASDLSETAPWGDDGFYFVCDDTLHRARRGQPPEPLLPGLQVDQVAAGPEGSLLLTLGQNQDAHRWRLWFGDGSHIGVSQSRVSRAAMSWNAARWLPSVGRVLFGDFAVPLDEVLALKRVKPRKK